MTEAIVCAVIAAIAAVTVGIINALSLSEATARAVQRIPDAHCNGDMETALEEEEKVKKEIQLFLAKQGVNNIIT